MRKCTMVLAAVLLALSVTAGFIALAEPPQPPPGEFCAANGDFGFSHDACVNCALSLLESSGGKGTFANCICKLIEDSGGFPPGASHGDCVTFFVSLF